MPDYMEYDEDSVVALPGDIQDTTVHGTVSSTFKSDEAAFYQNFFQATTLENNLDYQGLEIF